MPTIVSAGWSFTANTAPGASSHIRRTFCPYPFALIENLGTLRGNPQLCPSTYQLLKVSVPPQCRDSSISTPNFDETDLPDPKQTQAMGDRWLADRAFAFLRVPSAPAPESLNYLFNPLHPDASSLQIDWAKPIAYDRRLFHLSK